MIIKTHKHCMAAPVFAVLLMGSLLGGISRASFTASAVSGPSADGFMSLGIGSAAHIADGTRFEVGDETELQEGAVTILTRGKVALRAGDARIVAFDGGFFVAYDSHALSVAALTAPVLIERASEWSIVPIQSQVRMDGNGVAEPSGIPESFLQQKLAQLQSLDMMEKLSFPLTRSTSPAAPDDVLQFGSAIQRSEAEWGREMIANLRTLVSQKDVVKAVTLLRDSSVLQAVSLEENGGSLMLLMAEAKESSEVEALLFPSVAQNSEDFILLSLHPDLRSVAWTLPVPEGISKASRELRLILLPSTDVSAEAITPLVVAKWQADLSEVLHSSPDPAAFASILEQKMEGALVRMRDANYPERLERYSQALRHFRSEALNVIAPVMQQVISQWSEEPKESTVAAQPSSENIAAPGTDSESLPTESQTQVSDDVSALSPEQIETETRWMLQELGAVFTVETTVQALGPHAADVKTIVFSSPQGDRTFDFTYDVSKGEVRDIRENGGERMPYAVPIEKFLEWAK